MRRGGASVYQELLRHSSVYGVGLVLSRLASVVLLPFYTRFLTPADYGVVAILDLTSAILVHLGAGGMNSAVLRHHFEPRYRDRRHDLWTTGLVMLGAIALPQIAVVWTVRARLAALVFGGEVAEGAAYLSLALLTLPPRLFTAYAQSYLRAEKRSGLFLAITIPGLLVRIALNVYFIGFRTMGVFGFLWSGLLAGWAEAAVLFALRFAGRPFRLVREVVRPTWSYGWPLMLTALASLAMHQMDRYLLRWLLSDLAPIGIYAVAYTAAQGVSALVLVPFHSIWEAVTFEIDALPERLDVFQRVFRAFVLGIGLVLLGVAVLAVPIVRILAAEEFAGAADLLPWLCLAFLFFALDSVLRAPAMIHHRTTSVARTAIVAAGVNFGANWLLIPRLGIHGAAIASVITYATFALGGHAIYRRIEDLHFPMRTLAAAAAAGTLLTVAVRVAVPSEAWLGWHVVAGLAAWGLAAAAVLAGPARGLWEGDSPLRRALAGISGGDGR